MHNKQMSKLKYNLVMDYISCSSFNNHQAARHNASLIVLRLNVATQHVALAHLYMGYNSLSASGKPPNRSCFLHVQSKRGLWLDTPCHNSSQHVTTEALQQV